MAERAAGGRHSRGDGAARGVGVVARVADVAADDVVGVVGFGHQVAGVHTHLQGREHTAVCCHFSWQLTCQSMYANDLLLSLNRKKKTTLPKNPKLPHSQ